MPEEVFDDFTSRMTQQSAVQQLARRAPDMSRKQTRVPVLDVLPVSYFKNAGQDYSDTRRKKLTSIAWDNKYLEAEDLVTIMPVPDNVIDDMDRPIWDEALPYIIESISQKFDKAVINGTDAPNAWPDDLITASTAAGSTVTLNNGSTDLYDNILGEEGLYSKIEERGFDPNGNVGAIRFKAKLRGLRDSNGQPIFKRTTDNGQNVQAMTQYDIDAVPSFFPKNNAVDPAEAEMITGDWNQLIWAIRKDVTIDVFRTGVIQDPDTGDILYNLLQDDMSALRVVTRVAWQVPNPVNLTETDDNVRYPFAVLLPESS
jgi:HK97 family phage major capsid protein